MDRAALIEAAIARRQYSPRLRPRIERLLDGVEDRRLLRCCNSGCYVCSLTLLDILKEVETGAQTGTQTGICRPPQPV